MSLRDYVNSQSRPPTSFPFPRRSPLTSSPSAEQILVLTVDGRTLTGSLESCDQVTNLVLSNTIERVIRPAEDEEASAEVPHGLYLIRGDNVVCVGLVDVAMDKSIDWTKVRGQVLGSTKHV